MPSDSTRITRDSSQYNMLSYQYLESDLLHVPLFGLHDDIAYVQGSIIWINTPNSGHYSLARNEKS